MVAERTDDQVARMGAVATLPFAFHDPEFVTWWLTSLYLFKLEDQIAIAGLLSDAVHAPDAKREIEAFIEYHLGGTVAEQPERPTEIDVSASAVDVVLVRVRELWRSSPWMVAIGAVALLFFSGKAIWFVGKEFFRIVF